jgi:hypothetical protein
MAASDAQGTLPSIRNNLPISYDPNSNRLIIFGGLNQFSERITYDDSWVLTNANGLGGTPQWIKLSPTGPLPTSRRQYVSGYDARTNRLIVSLGLNDIFSTLLNDSWVLLNANGQCTAGQPCNYDVDATDPDAGETLIFSLDTAPTGMMIDPATGLIQWTPTPAQIGVHNVQVRVADPSGLFATQSFTLTVAPVTVPNVVGLNPTSAEALIGAADLMIGTETHTGGEIKLNFDTLPSAQGWTYLSTGVAELTVFSLSSGVLQQNTLGQDVQAASYHLRTRRPAPPVYPER